MPSEKERRYLGDILHHIDVAESFVAGMSPQELDRDERTFHAAVRCLEIISEASRRLSEELKARHPDLPWGDMAAAGNFYRHDYGGITSIRLWKTLRESLPPLRKAVEQELTRT